MADDPYQVLCGGCKVPLEARSENDGEMYACPSCGARDTRENVLAEVRDYVAEQAMQQLLDPIRGRRFVKVIESGAPKRAYRFVVDLKAPPGSA